MRDGVYHTGDVASRDADGYITYVGRADDVFKASDYRISPFEPGERAHRAPGRGRGRGGPLPRRHPARRPEGVRRAGGRPRAHRRDGRLDPGPLPGAPGAVQADPSHRVRRPAQDRERQDPPRRACAVVSSRRGIGDDDALRVSPLEFWESDLPR
nr:AMP-binding protein [Angustibacter aerolatus]